MNYRDFLAAKSQLGGQHGFEPNWLPDYLFNFQHPLCAWSIRRGRAAILAGCGLGKSPMQLVWAENVVRHANRPVLIVTTLGDSAQMVREGDKFQVPCHRSKDGKFPADARVVITNYERLHHFNPTDFAGCSCNESSAIKDMSSKTRDIVTEFMRTIPLRLLCSATPAPNDFVELGTSAEALGELGCQDMITKFFRKETSKDHLGWGRTKYRLRAHAERDFWRWICSWARAIRTPSDMGFDDGPFLLPPLTTAEHVVTAAHPRAGHLFDIPASDQRELAEERRRTLPERCAYAASLVNGTGQPAIVWCNLNPEGDLLEKLIPDAVQVSGADADDEKEESFDAFARGQARVLITKGSIAAWGLNWQHCAHQVYFPSDSYEQWHQGVRRCWRFGQTRPVQVDIVVSEGQRGVLANLQRKSAKMELMFDQLISLMHDAVGVDRKPYGTTHEELPEWLSLNKN